MQKISQAKEWKTKLDVHNKKPPIVMDKHRYANKVYINYTAEQVLIFEPHQDMESWQNALLCAELWVGNACVAELGGIKEVHITESYFNMLRNRGSQTSFEVHINEVQFNVNKVIVKFTDVALENDAFEYELTIPSKEEIEKVQTYLNKVINELQPKWKEIWNTPYENELCNKDTFPVKPIKDPFAWLK